MEPPALFLLLVSLARKELLTLFCLLTIAPVIADPPQISASKTKTTLQKAVSYLQVEVPYWESENGCFSCHNNGDGLTALSLARKAGYQVTSDVLAQTHDWLRKPTEWNNNKGEPGFSDKTLATLQFTRALSSFTSEPTASLRQAIELLASLQRPDGSWVIEPKQSIGSPGTYGTPLATALAARLLQQWNPEPHSKSIQRAVDWVRQQPPITSLNVSSILRTASLSPISLTPSQLTESINYLKLSQSSSGGWGPKIQSAPETFDTSIIVITLSQLKTQAELRPMIERGLLYLISNQLDDGGWEETTRPPGSISYAQHISTTAWATQALIIAEAHLWGQKPNPRP